MVHISDQGKLMAEPQHGFISFWKGKKMVSLAAHYVFRFDFVFANTPTVRKHSLTPPFDACSLPFPLHRRNRNDAIAQRNQFRIKRIEFRENICRNAEHSMQCQKRVCEVSRLQVGILKWTNEELLKLILLLRYAWPVSAFPLHWVIPICFLLRALENDSRAKKRHDRLPSNFMNYYFTFSLSRISLAFPRSSIGENTKMPVAGILRCNATNWKEWTMKMNGKRYAAVHAEWTYQNFSALTFTLDRRCFEYIIEIRGDVCVRVCVSVRVCLRVCERTFWT